MRPLNLYYVAHGYIYILNMYYKNYTIIEEVQCTTYCDFYTCDPRSSPQERDVAPSKKKKVGHP